jgi:anhydro-N-acetylmuramic acid kinase
VKKLSLGLMSGTSADGLSIAAVCVKPFKVAAFKTYPFGVKMQNEILNARNLDARALSRLSFRLGVFYAGRVEKFCREFKINYKDIAVIGSHGQTVGHWPGDRPGHTLQIGEASFLAEKTGVPVVCDFRPRDMAAGGCGAPLIPFFDEYVFGRGAPRLLLNIGGIANVTVTGRGVKTAGFDTGPGNCLMDAAVALVSRGKKTFDFNGLMAARGRADEDKLKVLLGDPYFKKPFPKSLDRAYFDMNFLRARGIKPSRENICDTLALLNLFTAESAAGQIKKLKSFAREVILSGGGALNPVLRENIKRVLPGYKISVSSAYGLDELAREPACFAVLAKLALDGVSNHCPAATGARGARVLGKIIPG